MAIDADLNAGLIDQAEAQRRRAEVTQQADFFAAMDGASKFVRGDAVASIVITLVNIVGGLAIGILDYGMGIGEAADLFTRLTIGDGLVTQVPAFLISLAAGLLVTRSTTSVDLPTQVLEQLFSRPQALLVTAAFLAVLVFTQLPAVPLVGIGAGCTTLALVRTRRRAQADAAARQQAAADPPPRVERVEDFLAVDPLEVEIGAGLIRLADTKRGGDLLERIQRVRQAIAAELGLLMPKVRVRDNLRLGRRHYRIRIADVPVAEGELSADQPVTVLVEHLAEVVRAHADELLSRDATRHLIEELKKTSPAVVDELIPGQMKLAEVQQILQLLLRERVSIRHLAQILETLGEHAPKCGDPILLAEHARRRLARSICTRYRDQHNRLNVILLDPSLEDEIAGTIARGGEGLEVRLPPQAIDALCRRIGEALDQPPAGRAPVVLVSPRIRAAVKQLTCGCLPDLVVLSYDEVTRDTQLESVATIDVDISSRHADLRSVAA
jgi:flagellar biosynthesis protein FlhA